MSAHTPGPWHATADLTTGAYGPSWTIRHDAQVVIAGVSGAALHRGAEQSAANAALIAAAPDLLDLLVKVLPYIETAEDDPAYKPGAVAKVTREILALIARAEGRS